MKYLFLIVLFASTFTAFGQAEIETQLDTLLAKYASNSAPGFSVGVSQNGKWLYKKGFGLANMEHQIPNTPTSVFRIASTSKQFTAASILLLEKEGKLSLNDRLQKFFPSFPEYAQDITVLQLLNHTSGIRDYLMLSYLAGMRDEDYYTDEEIMDWMENQEALNFEPGTRYNYSNSGYWLLGQIVAEVSGQSLAEYALEHLFTPLKMNNTHFHNQPNAIVANRASGYSPTRDGSYERCETTLPMIGDGGVFTTVEDFKLWTDELVNHQVFGEDFWTKMFTKGELNDGESISYALGLTHSEFNGTASIGHGGAFVGFLSQSLTFPEHALSITVLCNRNDVSPGRLARSIAGLLLPNETENTAKSVAASGPSKKTQKAKKKAKPALKEFPLFEGSYLGEDGLSFKVSLQEDTLVVTQLWNGAMYPIIPNAEGQFEIPGYKGVSFEFISEKKKPAHTLLILEDGAPSEYKRFSFTPLSTEALRSYAGTYYSKELLMSYQLVVKEDLLEVTIGNHPPFNLRQTNAHTFMGRGIIFHFDENQGAPAGFSIEAGRVQGIHFEK